jgi:hypothetical protein
VGDNNKHIACYSPGEEAIHVSITGNYKYIAGTAKQRLKGGVKRGTWMQAVATYSKQREMVLTNNNEQEE